MGGVDRLVAGAEIGVCEIVQEFVRTGAADDAVRIEPIGAPDGFAQLARGAFRIILQMIGRGLVSSDGLRRWPERVSFADSLNTRPVNPAPLLPGV
jgi:hypothetical protein